jgi:hypothetical protein
MGPLRSRPPPRPRDEKGLGERNRLARQGQLFYYLSRRKAPGVILARPDRIGPATPLRLARRVAEQPAFKVDPVRTLQPSPPGEAVGSGMRARFSNNRAAVAPILTAAAPKAAASRGPGSF